MPVESLLSVCKCFFLSFFFFFFDRIFLILIFFDFCFVSLEVGSEVKRRGVII